MQIDFTGMSPRAAAAIKVLLPIAAITIVLVVSKVRGISHERIGLRRPPLLPALGWFAIYVAWMLTTNYFMNWRGPWDFAPWVKQGPLVSVMRVLAVGILGPIAEELIFRGMLFARISATRLGEWGAVLILAPVWAVLHYSYSGGVIAVIAVAGLILGAARIRTKSVWVPIAMHIAWNLYAVW
jgi:membrane protease YdiL (CAAX protease family)